ncbi:MAG: hypothetical protein HY275_00415 [Gemmatimonadetes bacterium]|nr:hypothetical protein [Gemmatimonadota bacterium]
MRRVVSFAFAVTVALPLGAQGSLVARFSESQLREPTFVVSRSAYVAVFEVLDGGRVVQRFPRVEAQARFALPAGESLLSDLDIPLGRVTEAPGSRTVFWSGGRYGTRPVAYGSAPAARTLVLVASTSPLRVGPSAEFPALFRGAFEKSDSTRSRDDRTVATIAELVRPEGAADVATELTTMWLTDYREFRGAAASIASGDPLPSNGIAGGCGGYNIGVLTTYSQELACGAYQPVWMGGGWSYSFGAGYVPYFPIFFVPTRTTANPGSRPNTTVGVLPGQRVTPTGPFGGSANPRITRVAEPPVEEIPQARIVRWNGGIAGAPMTGGPAVGSGPALGAGGGGGGPATRAGGTSGFAPIIGAIMPSLPPGAPPPAHAGPVATSAPVLAAPAGAHPVTGAPASRGPAPAGAPKPGAAPAPVTVKKQ